MKRLIVIVLLASACSKSNDPAPVIILGKSVNESPVYNTDQNFKSDVLGWWKSKKYNLPDVNFTAFLGDDQTHLWSRYSSHLDSTYYFRYRIAGDSILFGWSKPFKVDSVWHFKVSGQNAEFTSKRAVYYYSR